MSDPHPPLDIFIIGGRLGESIVIRTPGGEVGVIDSYARDPEDPDTNPTIDRLDKLKARRLRFVSMTHPHMDHFSGLLTVFRKYKANIAEFWRPPFGERDWSVCFSEYIEELRSAKTRSDEKATRTAIDVLKKILSLAEEERASGRMDLRVTEDKKELLRERDHDFEIISLGPSATITYPYQVGFTKRVIKKGPHNSNAHHNTISSVLAVRYGKWIGLFGGDTEQKSWNDVIKRCGADWLSKACFVKVSHHGSPTGSYARLWNSIGAEHCDVALTCYEAQKLPKAEGLQYIYEKRYPLHSTNKQIAALLGTGKKPEPIPHFEMTGLSDEWRAQLTGEVRIRVAHNGVTTVNYDGAAGLVKAPVS
jgi:beta-lactamase superfamily II metal-dependent hydrolase